MGSDALQTDAAAAASIAERFDPPCATAHPHTCLACLQLLLTLRKPALPLYVAC
jgi:hypothetical protein